jgi:hypothetical protein
MSTVLDMDLEQHKSEIYEIVNRTDSDWVKKGTEKYVNPVKINSAKTHNLPVRSRVCLGKNKGYAETMYVLGAPTIFVEDLWVDKNGGLHALSEQKKDGWELQRGLKSLGYNLQEEYKKSSSLWIRFEFGVLDLAKYGDDPILRRFVDWHENNVEAPNAKDNASGKNRMWDFRAVQKAMKAEKKLAGSLDAKKEAIDYVFGMRVAVANKPVVYNEQLIDATINRFDIKGGLEDLETYPQKLEVILQYADGNPQAFMDTIREQNEELKVKIVTAINLKVIAFVKNEVILHDDSKGGRTMYKAKATKLEEQITELCDFFYTSVGEQEFNNMIILLEEAKSKA